MQSAANNNFGTTLIDVYLTCKKLAADYYSAVFIFSELISRVQVIS